jgi:hypothetical protein
MMNKRKEIKVIDRLTSLIKIPKTVVIKLTMVREECNGAGLRKDRG